LAEAGRPPLVLFRDPVHSVILTVAAGGLHHFMSVLNLIRANRALGTTLASVLSGRQVELLQERGISRVVVQALQQGVHFREDQAPVTLGICSV
jgi:hypothetical protein